MISCFPLIYAIAAARACVERTNCHVARLQKLENVDHLP
ncbi:hypothetical protein K788_0008158 [Paraburkholderia caribensis MBA4]|uniref:Uncharacterized protein n=1 Tax=Paraburkholderia caribensis MBA4 TaxID=1323664 RepID=A0A0P0RG92_9BURK|nr:hypothetical protein K788_0008158 [Paraburkholderia caribensis MBA4]